MGAVVDYQSAPLSRSTASGQRVTEIGNVLSLAVGGRYALSDRVDVGAALPLVLHWDSDLLTNGGAPNLGDMRLYGRFGITKPSSPVHFALIPEVRVPTGATAVNLGDSGVGGRVTGALSASVGVLRVTGNLAGEWRSFEAAGNAQPGLGMAGGLAIGVQPLDDLALYAEWRGTQRLRATELDEAPDDFVPAARGGETLITGKGRLGGQTWLGAGVGLGTPAGFGASPLRAILQVGSRFGGDPEAAAARLDRAEARRIAREQPPVAKTVPVVVSIQDETGTPLDAALSVDGGRTVQATSGTARLSLPPGEHRVDVTVDGFGPQARELDLRVASTPEQVRFILLPRQGDGVVFVDLGSPQDTPIDDATISIDGRPIGESASGGGVLVGGLGTQDVVFEARAPSFREGSVTLTPSAQADPVELLLARERGAVQLVVAGSDDQPVPDVRARFLGPDRLGSYGLGEHGQRTFVLRPGSWQVLVSHPDFGLQQRGVDLQDEDSELAIVRFVLQQPESGSAELDLRVVDPGGVPVPDAEISLDGVSYGRTSTAGTLSLQDLAEGVRTVTASGPDLEPSEAELVLHDGVQEHLLVTRWRPGATLFRARSPGGMATDASVRGRGPASLSTLELGKDGVGRATLDPGDWELLFSSPSLGMAQQSATVDASPGSLTTVDATLGSPEAPGTTLELDIVDPEAHPVQGAVVRLDGAVVGRTATTGSLSVTDAGAGSRGLRIDAEPFAPQVSDLRLSGERMLQKVSMRWAAGAARVSVRRGGEPVEGALVRIGGPHFVPPTPVGPDGRRLFALAPGSWQVLVSAPELGLKQAALEIPARAQLTELVVDLEPVDPNAAQTIVRVQAPDGRPIDRATVQLDDRAPVPAPGGFAAFTDVEDGEHSLTISAPDFEPVIVQEVALRKGISQRIVPMEWVPRELPIEITGLDGEPVNAMLIATSPEAREAIETGADGRAELSLDPRSWEILVRADGLRVARVQVPEGASTDAVRLSLGPARVTVDGAVMTTAEPIYFETGKSTVGPASRDLLDELADTLIAHPELVRVEISGHTDSTGSVSVNMRLSRQRAEAVVAALVARGVAPERLDAQGFGPTRPTASNDTPDGRAMNRRVELVSETGD